MSSYQPLLDVAEAAAYLHLKRGYVYQLCSKGKLAYTKPTGGRLLFLRSDLDALIEKGRKPPAHERAIRAVLDRPRRDRRAR